MNIVKKGFTLIELLVGITISIILMLSVSVFVSSGMKNIAGGQKILENSGNFSDFSFKLQNTFNYTSSGSYFTLLSSTGVLFKRGQFFSEGGFSYIGEKTIDGSLDTINGYCLSGSEDTITNHVIIKTFVPFEEIGEDMFSDYNLIFSGSVGIYKSDALNHVILDGGNNIIVGKGIYGDNFKDGDFGKGVYLNNPTGLALDTVNNILFISDTLNNRILYYDILSKKIYKLLDKTDGILEPTGLVYNNNKLYISNSGRGEILEYSSDSSIPDLEISFNKQNNVNKVDITFSGSSDIVLSNYNTSNISFTSSSISTDFLTGSINNLKYYAVNYSGVDIFQATCSGTEIDLVGDNPIKCTGAGTGQTSSYQNMNLTNIVVSNIIGATNTGSYYVDLKLLSSTNSIIYQKYFPYFTLGDDDLTTSIDNSLRVVYSGLGYPTGINISGNDLLVNDFISRKQYKIGIDGLSKIDNAILPKFNFGSLSYNNISDYILLTPLKSLLFDYTDNQLTMLLKYYKKYNCYNLDDNSERSYLLKKNF